MKKMLLLVCLFLSATSVAFAKQRTVFVSLADNTRITPQTVATVIDKWIDDHPTLKLVSFNVYYDGEVKNMFYGVWIVFDDGLPSPKTTDSKSEKATK